MKINILGSGSYNMSYSYFAIRCINSEESMCMKETQTATGEQAKFGIDIKY
jgi:hypothetical protein